MLFLITRSKTDGLGSMEQLNVPLIVLTSLHRTTGFGYTLGAKYTTLQAASFLFYQTRRKLMTKFRRAMKDFLANGSLNVNMLMMFHLNDKFGFHSVNSTF